VAIFCSAGRDGWISNAASRKKAAESCDYADYAERAGVPAQNGNTRFSSSKVVLFCCCEACRESIKQSLQNNSFQSLKPQLCLQSYYSLT
jgi:hypothetical protein